MMRTRSAVGFFIAITTVYVLVALYYGPIMTSDGHRDYDLAKLLKAVSYDLSAYNAAKGPIRAEHLMTQPDLPYLGYYAYLSLLMIVAPTATALAQILSQAIVLAGAATLFTFSFARLAPGRLTVILTGLFFAGCWELLQWNSMTQSDVPFLAIVLMTMSLLIRFLMGEGGRRWRPFLGALALALLSLAVRPQGALLLGCTIYIGAVVMLSSGSVRSLRWATAAIPFLAASGIMLGALLVWRPNILPVSIQESFELYRQFIIDGHVVWERPETYVHGVTDSYGGILRVAAARVLYFFWFRADGFSTVHTLANIVFFVPVYSLAAIGLMHTFIQRDINSVRVGFLAVVFAFAFVTLHAFTLIDFDWRYRAPIYPSIFMMSVIGFSVAGRIRRGLLW